MILKRILMVVVWGFVTVSFGASDWPVLKVYDGPALRKVKLPVGGIGTGTISLSGNGGLVDWEICNTPAKGNTPDVNDVASGFLVRIEETDGKVSTRLLEGPIDPSLYEGAEGCKVPNHAFPRFSDCAFKAAYPLAQVELVDRSMPVKATLEAMNPLVPGDSAASAIPAALFRWCLTNKTAKPLKVSLMGLLVNPVAGGSMRAIPGAPFIKRVINGEKGLQGVGIAAADLTRSDNTKGEVVMVVPDGCGEVGMATRIADSGWKVRFDKYWKQFVATGKAADFFDPTADDVGPDHDLELQMVALSVAFELAPGESRRIPFVVAWRFPHRPVWPTQDYRATPVWGPFAERRDAGNWYATRYADASAAAADLLKRLPDLEAKTVAFVKSVVDSKAPAVVKESALFNLSTLRTETCFRTADGHFYGWEGVFEKGGSCYGSCTHVWGYEHALVDLWPDLARDMTELQFGMQMGADGHIAFRIHLPLQAGESSRHMAAADGQLQCIIKAYENWQKGGGDQWLKGLWPNIRKAVEFCWIPGGWDADQDGLMEGCQHNTMDVEYYGPNPQMGFLYLAALKAAAAMADACEDAPFAQKCRGILASGSKLIESRLFNGEWYEHRVEPPKAPVPAVITSGATRNLADPDYQLAKGCLVDQLLGDYASRHVGLGAVADEKNSQKALDTILKRNGAENFAYNCGRDYSLPGERSLKMAWYAPGSMPKKPFPYYGENMTGFEYVVAANLAQRGDFARAEQLVRNIRDRYDGVKRNPFDECECGHHYVRALAAWSVYRAFINTPRP